MRLSQPDFVMASHDYYSQDHLNKPLPPPLTSSPAPMDGPHRQDTVGSYASSQYSQRGNTIPGHQAYPARSDTYASAVPSLPSIPPQHRQDTYTSSVYTAPAPYGAPAPSLYSNAPSYSTNPPSYTTQQHLGTQPPGQEPSPVSTKSVSPFDTVFDDHAYPATSYQSAGSSRQHLTGQDTSYHGSNGSPSDDRGHPQDAIPLQDRGAKDPSDDLDHVYEAPQRRRKEKKQGVRFGELGMFGAYGNRIPWVVYIFTVVQVGVFIGEIVKNGKNTLDISGTGDSATDNIFCSPTDQVSDHDETIL